MTDTIKPETQNANAATPKKARKQQHARRKAHEPKPGGTPVTTDEPEAPRPSARQEPRGCSKVASVIALLKRPDGATLAEMVDATGWLPHTTRAALTGLKKKGHIITKDKRDDLTCYRIAKAN
jgi:hypothetical protein